MLTPSTGFCATPLMLAGDCTPTASRMVGAMSMTWWNCVRMPPVSLMRFALDVDDQRVFHLAHLLDRVEDAPHLVVAVRKRGSVHFHHVGKELLFIGVEAVPCRDAFGPRRQLGARRDDAHLLLPCKGFLP